MFKFEMGQVLYFEKGRKIECGKVIGRTKTEAPLCKERPYGMEQIVKFGNKLGISRESYELEIDDGVSTQVNSDELFTCWEQFRDEHFEEFKIACRKTMCEPRYCECGRNVIVNEPNKFCSLCNRGI